MDLDAWTDGSNPLQTNTPGIWGSFLNAHADSPSQWKCSLVAPWAKSSNIVDMSCIPKYQALFKKVRAWGCQQCWIFWAPPSEPPLAARAMQANVFKRILSETGATGAIVDHPARHAVTLDVSFAFLKQAKAMGLATGWCFNGNDSASATAAMVQRVNSALGGVDVWTVDGFESQTNGWAQVSTQLDAVTRDGKRAAATARISRRVRRIRKRGRSASAARRNRRKRRSISKS